MYNKLKTKGVFLPVNGLKSSLTRLRGRVREEAIN